LARNIQRYASHIKHKITQVSSIAQTCSFSLSWKTCFLWLAIKILSHWLRRCKKNPFVILLSHGYAACASKFNIKLQIDGSVHFGTSSQQS